jgi:hyperosmotically inducible protein
MIENYCEGTVMNKHYKLSIKILAACVVLLALPACHKQDSGNPPTATVGIDLDDSVITGKVKAALLANETVKNLDISVSTHQGVVTLTGFVNSKSQIDIGMDLARGVQGVTTVENQLTVKGALNTVGANIDDNLITTQVKAKLFDDDMTKSFDIAVTTRNGEVQLTGLVDNEYQALHSAHLAQGIDGVKSVLNHMTVKGQSTIAAQ